MSPTPTLSFSATPAYLRRLVLALLSSTLVLFLAGAAFATIEGPRPIGADAFVTGTWDPNELPDVAVLVTGLEVADPSVERSALPALRDLFGVAAVDSEFAPSGRLALDVSLTPEAPAGVVAAIETVLAQELPDATVSIGGRNVADQELLNSLNRGTVVAVVPVLILVSVLIAAGFGLRFGLAAGGTIALSSLLGGVIGGRVATFDGSLGTTAVPSVLVALLVSTVLTFRLLDWFKQPQGTDPADAIRRAVRHLAPEAGLLFGGLLLTALLLSVVGSSPAPASVVAVGGLFGAVVTLGALPAVLASLPAVPDDEAYSLLGGHAPDGRDLPLAALAGFTCFLLGLGLFAIRVPDVDLMDESDLVSGAMSRRVAEQMTELGGDPTSALLASLPGESDDRVVADWAMAASSLTDVGSVETDTGRYRDGVLVAAPEAGSDFTTSTGTRMAIVTPIVSARSAQAQRLVGTLEASLLALAPESAAASEAPSLAGPAVDARDAAERGSALLWPLVVLLAVSGGLSVLLLVGDLALAFLATLLRLIGTAALLGVYHLVAGTVTGAELQIAALILSVGVGLFEIGFLRRINRDLQLADRSDEPDDGTMDRGAIVGEAFRREGRAAMLGLGVTALCGIGFVASDLDVARRLGVAVAAGLVIELLIGTWLLRPAVLGERALGLSLLGRSGRNPADGFDPAGTAVRADLLEAQTDDDATSDRVALIGVDEALAQDPLAPSVSTVDLDDESRADDVVAPVTQPAADVRVPPMDPEWRRIVSGLLRAEFDFQTHPVRAQLETVFIDGTPLFGELTDHNRRLRASGLRVVGRGPTVHKLTVVNDGSPVTLAVTVDHPPRQLVDRDGKLLGTRAAERREGLLWLVRDPSGRHRIAEAVDLGVVTPVVTPVTERGAAHGPDAIADPDAIAPVAP